MPIIGKSKNNHRSRLTKGLFCHRWNVHGDSGCSEASWEGYLKISAMLNCPYTQQSQQHIINL